MTSPVSNSHEVPQNIRLAVDAVVFGYHRDHGVSVLLINRKYPPFKDQWAIPGGFVLDPESLEEAVTRELREESGIEVNYLEQLYTFGKPDRDPRYRVVSVAYFGLVRPDTYQLSASTDAQDAAWFNINELPSLAFDHHHILEAAILRLRNKIQYEPLGFDLLGEKFPFSELEVLYSHLLGEPIDRRNFKKKVMSWGILEELDEYAPATGRGRRGKLFRLNKTKYEKLRAQGVYFEL